MAKITLISQRAYDFNGYTGFSYVGFLENKTAIKFSSKNDYSESVFSGGTQFDNGRAVDLDLVLDVYDGKPKWKDKSPELSAENSDE